MTNDVPTTSNTASAVDLTGLRCPECDYELTGLSKMQCPECGQAFDPTALRSSQAGNSADSASLLRYARFIRNCAIANLIVQVIVSILNAYASVLIQHTLLSHGTLAIIQGIGLSVGILGGVIGVTLAFGIIVYSGVRNCFRASWLGLAIVILSTFSVFLSLLNLGQVR